MFGVISDICKQDASVIGINLSRNFGQHSAIMSGLHHVSGDFVVCLDDDGQTPADEVFSLIDKIDDGYDIVFAEYINKKHSPARNLGSFVNEIMARYIIGKPKNLAIMSYFACKRFIIDEIIKYQNPYPYIAGLLLQTTKKIVNVPVNHRERKTGTSGYSFRKLISLWLNGFTSFSIKPLRLGTFLGVACAVLGFLYAAFIIIRKLIVPETPMGYSSTMAALLFIGGMIILILGMLGEYVGRIYLSINNSPQFIVREMLNVKKNDE